ncbi:Egg cell-secreted protein 1.4 [Zostera marina]|uniref:Egg cell-secreted protein 1.4 n=1 Tax=Zostera marina TaxID=29655 RepID=A0A0K9NU88_ZOSMR|nr:Egg cell-secreted protein 1.4 [Zostera marina]
MGLRKPTSLVLALCCILLIGSAVAREGLMENRKILPLLERLESSAGAGGGNCWSALFKLSSCTNEIILFFVNGESYLGMECCRSIRIITHQCWPSMLSSVGYTAEEGDILRGYCDATTIDADAAAPTRII